MRRFPAISFSCRAALWLCTLVVVVAACSIAPSGQSVLPAPSGVKGPDKQPAAGSNNTEKKGIPTPIAPEQLTYNIVDLTSSERKRKTSEQLQKSLIMCVGAESEFRRADGGSSSAANFDVTLTNPAILQISQDMFLSDVPLAQNDGRVRFLIPRTGASSLNIVDLERTFLDSSAGGATGVYADTLEDVVYLNSLFAVASVVAFNCDVRSDSNSACNCSNQEAAAAMLQRCLPQFDPKTAAFKEALEKLSNVENCGAPETPEGFLKRRRAIASLLSSYAFATAK